MERGGGDQAAVMEATQASDVVGAKEAEQALSPPCILEAGQ